MSKYIDVEKLKWAIECAFFDCFDDYQMVSKIIDEQPIIEIEEK